MPPRSVRLTSAVHLQNGVRLPRKKRGRKSPFWQVQPLVSRQQPFGGLKQPASAEVRTAFTLCREAPVPPPSTNMLGAERVHHRSGRSVVDLDVAQSTNPKPIRAEDWKRDERRNTCRFGKVDQDGSIHRAREERPAFFEASTSRAFHPSRDSSAIGAHEPTITDTTPRASKNWRSQSNHPSSAVRLTSAVHLQNGVRLPCEKRGRKSPFWQVQQLVSRQPNWQVGPHFVSVRVSTLPWRRSSGAQASPYG